MIPYGLSVRSDGGFGGSDQYLYEYLGGLEWTSLWRDYASYSDPTGLIWSGNNLGNQSNHVASFVGTVQRNMSALDEFYVDRDVEAYRMPHDGLYSNRIDSAEDQRGIGHDGLNYYLFRYDNNFIGADHNPVWNNSLNLFFGIKSDGSIYSSLDGTSYQDRTSPSLGKFYGIAYSPISNRMIVCGHDRLIFQSTDGDNWTQIETDIFGDFEAIAFDPAGNRWIIVDNNLYVFEMLESTP